MILEETLYQQSVRGKTKVWKLHADVAKGILTTTWGLLDGALQQTDDVVQPKGKEGTKAYKNVQTQTVIEFNRAVQKRLDKGYTKNLKQVASVTEVGKLDFDNLPVGFCPPKPIKKYPSDAEIEKMLKETNLILQKKTDGSYCLVVRSESGIRLYTRTLEEETLNFPDLVTDLEHYPIPVGTILCGELFVGSGTTMAEFDLINSMTPRTKPAKAIEKQKDNPVKIIFFDLLYYDGEDWTGKRYRDRYNRIGHMGITCDVREKCQVVHNMPLKTLKAFHQAIKELGVIYTWEGFVLRDINSTTELTLNGKERRPKGCWKVKNIQEDDFVATGFHLGTGRNRDVVGKLELIQYDRKGNEINCGQVGIGFNPDYEQRKEALDWDYPVVVKVQYDRRQVADGSCKLRFPVFLAMREDKRPKECVI